jgi:hypothetical protein
VPELQNGEVKKRLLDKVAAKGIADGFEEFIREIAIQNPIYIEVNVSREAAWADVSKALGQAEKIPGREAASKYGGTTWYNTGKIDSGDWLSFGVISDQVRHLRASFPSSYYAPNGVFPVDSPLLPVEMVPGGRSLPDPEKAVKKGKFRPAAAGPREIEFFEKLGVARDCRVVLFDPPRKTNKVDADEIVQEAIGKALYPNLLAAARKLQRTQVSHLIVTPSLTMSLDEMTDIMNDTPFRTYDSKTFPGTKVRWYRYHQWLEVGIADGQVKKIRINCSNVPPKL